MNLNVITAVFKRNLVGYFSSPIGYLFILVFVLLSGLAAFWPNEFFNNNLATLDQLNEGLPWIMLVFIPAITMSLWADERRQGTDELLLTLPCSDLDVVLGKYLAAVAIFTVALAFSLSNILVLRGLGQPDMGLVVGNYLGYWLVGAAMLAIGMVASFLTSSLTVGFVLGLIFNAPLVFAHYATEILPQHEAGRFLKSVSIAEQFYDFGRGLVTLSSVAFFLSIIVISLYLSMVLIGRRHWAGGRRGRAMSLHYLVRAVALAAVALSLNVIIQRFDWRLDLSSERLNSLSPQTSQLMQALDTRENRRPVYIEAFVSPTVPEEYVATRLSLLAMLREAQASSNGNIIVRLHHTNRFSEEEALAQSMYGIQPRPVQSSSAGRIAVDEIMLAAAFQCGLDKVVIPFFDRGTPVEYEIVRSIATVSQQQRKTIGVLMTDARLFGGFDMDSFSQRPNQQIIEELQKQYDVVQVNADQPITQRFDALLAVQPSSLTAPQMENFVAAVRSGQPTAIFEDPFPFMDQNLPATTQPRRPPSRNPFMQQQQPSPKGDVNRLWDALGAQLLGGGQHVIWQQFNPYPKIAEFDKVREFVFIGKHAGASEPFNQDHPITSQLQQIVTLFAGGIEPRANSNVQITPLLQTGTQSGFVQFDDVLVRDFFGRGNINPNRRMHITGKPYTIAAHITDSVSLNVVLVADADLLASEFFAIRARGTDRSDPIQFNFDNVTFILNTLDYLAKDERFVDLRKRRPAYRTLTTIEEQTELARRNAQERRDHFMQSFETKRAEEQQKLDAKLEELRQRQGVDPQQALIEVATAQQAGQNRLNSAVEALEKERDAELQKIERDLTLQTRAVQNKYKFAAVVFPAIPPLLVGAFMFQRRRSMERVGVPKARMK